MDAARGCAECRSRTHRRACRRIPGRAAARHQSRGVGVWIGQSRRVPESETCLVHAAGAVDQGRVFGYPHEGWVRLDAAVGARGDLEALLCVEPCGSPRIRPAIWPTSARGLATPSGATPMGGVLPSPRWWSRDAPLVSNSACLTLVRSLSGVDGAQVHDALGCLGIAWSIPVCDPTFVARPQPELQLAVPPRRGHDPPSPGS